MRPLPLTLPTPIDPTEEFTKQPMTTGGTSRLAPGKAALERQTGQHNAILASSSLDFLVPPLMVPYIHLRTPYSLDGKAISLCFP